MKFITFCFCLLLNLNAFSKTFMKMKASSTKMGSFVSGKSTKHLEHGDLIKLYKSKVVCNAVRGEKEVLSFDCVSNSWRDRVRFKKPCVYDETLYMHGDLIPVNPGVWIFYRGEVIPMRPGEMLICNDGNLDRATIPLR